MIDSLKLANFQSHEDNLIEFHPGINAITGESDNGKTALLRALYLARYNQPSGDSFVSKWARNEKGKQKEDMMVTVVKDGNTLIRGKGKSLNGYDVNGKVLEALGKGGLPSEVENFFNMTDVNIQQQMDTPFLIGQKPSEITRFLNTIVDMTEIDLYLSAVDSKKRSTKKDIVRVTTEITQLQKDVESYNGLDKVASVVNKLGKVGNRKNRYNESLNKLTTSINTYINLKEKSVVWDGINTVEGLLKKVTPLINKRTEKLNSLNVLSRSIKEYTKLQSILKNTPPTEKIEPLLKKVSKLIEQRVLLQKDIKILKSSIIAYENNSNKIKKLDVKLIELEESLPELCPTCGQVWEGGNNE